MIPKFELREPVPALKTPGARVETNRAGMKNKLESPFIQVFRHCHYDTTGSRPVILDTIASMLIKSKS